MGYDIEVFKNYKIKETDYIDEYKLEILNKKSDWKYIYPSIIFKINNYLEEDNLDFLNIVNYLGEINLECLNKKEIERIKFDLITPVDCLKFIKNNELIEKISEDKPKGYERMLLVINNLVKLWQNDYYILMTY